MRFARFALVALLVVIALQVAYYAPRLPRTVASHFGLDGQPDGWMPKTAFLELYAVIVVITVGPFLLLPLLLKRIPDDLVNLPHKDYWLAPERRDETHRTIAVYLVWFGVGTLMLVSHVMGVSFAASLDPGPASPGTFWWALGLYLAFTVVWLVLFVRRFRQPRSGPSTG